jgi:coenzyme PQQ biosynthesis protein C
VSALLTPEELEAELRQIGEDRYHWNHPFHKAMKGGELTKGQVQAWALNRYYYQSRIPIKDAAVMARMDDPELRRAWRQRIIDHDGERVGEGGIERWLRLTEGLGLDRAYVISTAGVLPATRFAVDAYVHFVRERTLLEAIASSLTEMFSPRIIADRVSGMLANYDFVSRDTLAYFQRRLDQAPRDADFALDYVKREARRPEQQQQVQDALRFKCDVLWAQLDALEHAYATPGRIPVGAFCPEPS